MQHLSSRTLKPSRTQSFVDAWTSSLAGSRVNPSAMLASVKQLKILDTSFPTSGTESETANLELFSWKTLRESSPPRPQTENQFSSMSSESWKAWVTEQRQEYSQRVKSAQLTREREFLSLGSGMNWGTPATNDANKTPHCEVNSKQAGLTRSVGRAEANWATPQTFDANNLVRTPEKLAQTRAEKNAGCMNLREQVHYPDMDHSRKAAKNWPTARSSDSEGGRIETEMTEKGFKSKRHKSNQTFGAKLRDAVETHEEGKNWPTPATRDFKGANSVQHILGKTASKKGHMGQLPNAVLKDGLQDQANLNTNGKSQGSWPTPRANKVHPEITDQNREQLANRGKANLEEDVAGHCGKATGKLNPNWVEQLMGLPVGWTDLGFWATESSQLPQPKPSSPSSKESYEPVQDNVH